MYKMRDSWTDERLDDFRDEVNRRFDKVDTELHRVNDRLDDLHRMLFQFAAGGLVTLIAGVAGFLATQL
jgi:hypothetical protein